MRSEEAMKRKYDYITKYKKDKLKRVCVLLDKEYYANVLVPSAKAKGMSITSYVKEALQEKIERR